MLPEPLEARDEEAGGADASLLARVGPAVLPTLGRYRVVERIAAGSMGVVYRAEDRHLGRDVALKVLRLESHRRTRRDESIARARFMQEARAMARIEHPNVVPIYGIEAAAEHLVIAMEYVPGQTLAEWLQTPRTWREIVDVLLDAGEGLAAAHAAGAVHRDFKPHNVLVGSDGRVRVTDFGLALVREEPDEPTEDEEMFDAVPSGDPLASLTQTGMSVGTPAYMAPEQHVGRSTDPRSDQYAFCATLYEALYGTRPFRGRDNIELSQAKRRLKLCRPVRGTSGAHKVPAWLAAAVRRGLAPIAAERFASMHELFAALRGPASRRIPVLAAVGGALIGVVVGAALASATWAMDDQSERSMATTSDAAAAAPATASAHRELGRCRRSLAAGAPAEAEAQCARAYFGALDSGAFIEASTAADLLARLRESAGAPAEAAHWRRHAKAARRRATP